MYDSNGEYVGGRWPITTRNTAEYEYYDGVLEIGSNVTEIEPRCEIYTPKGNCS